MSALPPPPPPLAPPSPDVPAGASGRWSLTNRSPQTRPPRPGELTNAWRGTFMVGWGCVVLALAAIWQSARTMGLSTWWLGASSDPQFLLVQLVPFVPAIVLVLLAARNVRFLPYLGAIGALALAAVATGDLDRFDRLAVAELVVAAAALCVSLASFAGLLHRADAATDLADAA